MTHPSSTFSTSTLLLRYPIFLFSPTVINVAASLYVTYMVLICSNFRAYLLKQLILLFFTRGKHHCCANLHCTRKALT